jgi:hypothetical protein
MTAAACPCGAQGYKQHWLAAATDYVAQKRHTSDLRCVVRKKPAKDFSTGFALGETATRMPDQTIARLSESAWRPPSEANFLTPVSRPFRDVLPSIKFWHFCTTS